MNPQDGKALRAYAYGTMARPLRHEDIHPYGPQCGAYGACDRCGETIRDCTPDVRFVVTARPSGRRPAGAQLLVHDYCRLADDKEI